MMFKKLSILLTLILFVQNIKAETPQDKPVYNLTFIFSTVRENRQGHRVGNFVAQQLKRRGHNVTIVDPIEYNFSLLDKRLTDYEEGKAPIKMQELGDIIKTTDGIIVVSGIYNGGTPPALKNLLDHFIPPFYRKRPAAIVTYSASSFGGVQVIAPLRLTLAGLGMVSLPRAFSVSDILKTFDEKGELTNQSYIERIQGFIDDLEWYAGALKNWREVHAEK